MRSLYFTNRKEYYRRKKISIALKKYWANKKIKSLIEEEEVVLRYSVSYMIVRGEDYGLTVRAYILNPDEERRKRIISELENAIKEKFKIENTWGLKIGYEKEYIDLVEAGNDPRNKIIFEGI